MRRVTLENGFVDLEAILFVVGGVSSVVMTLLTIPIVSVIVPANVSEIVLIVMAISIVCSLGAIHCYTLVTRRRLTEAGMRGIIFGALLLIFSLGFISSFSATSTQTWLMQASAGLVLIGGIICFILHHTVARVPSMMPQQQILERQRA